MTIGSSCIHDQGEPRGLSPEQDARMKFMKKGTCLTGIL